MSQGGRVGGPGRRLLGPAPSGPGRPRHSGVRLLLLPVLTALSGCGGCGTSDPLQPGREYVKDMIDAVPYESFSPNPVLSQGMTLQSPAPGSLPRGLQPFHYGPGPEEAARAGRELRNPLTASKENLERGDKVFHTICFTCHGLAGEGDGPVVPRFPAPPSLTGAHARGLPDGQIFHIITRGQGLMPSHAAQVRPDDRWKVALYIRQMQGGKP